MKALAGGKRQMARGQSRPSKGTFKLQTSWVVLLCRIPGSETHAAAVHPKAKNPTPIRRNHPHIMLCDDC
jgi:hypothetical protein